MMEYGECEEKNFVRERRRCWETHRKRRDGGSIIWYEKEVDWSVATSDDIAWFY